MRIDTSLSTDFRPFSRARESLERRLARDSLVKITTALLPGVAAGARPDWRASHKIQRTLLWFLQLKVSRTGPIFRQIHKTHDTRPWINRDERVWGSADWVRGCEDGWETRGKNCEKNSGKEQWKKKNNWKDKQM